MTATRSLVGWAVVALSQAACSGPPRPPPQLALVPEHLTTAVRDGQVGVRVTYATDEEVEQIVAGLRLTELGSRDEVPFQPVLHADEWGGTVLVALEPLNELRDGWYELSVSIPPHATLVQLSAAPPPGDGAAVAIATARFATVSAPRLRYLKDCGSKAGARSLQVRLSEPIVNAGELLRELISFSPAASPAAPCPLLVPGAAEVGALYFECSAFSDTTAFRLEVRAGIEGVGGEPLRNENDELAFGLYFDLASIPASADGCRYLPLDSGT